MKTRQNSYEWDNTAIAMKGGQNFDELLAEQYRRVHLNLIYRWSGDIIGMKILKTDLFAEALCTSRSFLWDIAGHPVELFGIDVSAEIVRLAGVNFSRNGKNPGISLAVCDVRHAGFTGNSFDLIISDSTLDHFSRKEEIRTALNELARLLKPGGILIITLDNGGNFTEPLFQLWKILKLSPFYIGKTLTIKELVKEIENTGMSVRDCTAILHNPRFFTKAIIAACKRLAGHRMDNSLRKWLANMDKQENSRTKYLTAQFIAVKAIKKTV